MLAELLLKAEQLTKVI